MTGNNNANDKENIVTRTLNWLRKGYPRGIPSQDTFAVMYVLKHELTDADIEAVMSEMVHATGPDAPLADKCITEDEIGSYIQDMTQQAPEPADIERVKTRLKEGGFPVE